MKDIYSIGRDYSCDIVLQDDSNVISRVHAFLRVRKGGKYTISDQSMNGTYVNGIRLSSGVEVPVSRKDTISFAHMIELDWSLIPNPNKKKRIVLFSSLAVVLICAAMLFVAYMFRSEQPKSDDDAVVMKDTTVVVVDTAKVENVVEPVKEIVFKPKHSPEKKVEKKNPKTKVEKKTEDSEPAVIKEQVDETAQVEEKKDTIQPKQIFDSIY